MAIPTPVTRPLVRQYEWRRHDDRIANGPHDKSIIDQEVATDSPDPLVLVKALKRFLICNQFERPHEADHSRFADERVLAQPTPSLLQIRPDVILYAVGQAFPLQ